MRIIKSKARKIRSERTVRSQVSCKRETKRKIGKNWSQRWEKRYSYEWLHSWFCLFSILPLFFLVVKVIDASHRSMPTLGLLLLPQMLRSGEWCSRRHFLLYLRHTSASWSIVCGKFQSGEFLYFGNLRWGWGLVWCNAFLYLCCSKFQSGEFLYFGNLQKMGWGLGLMWYILVFVLYCWCQANFIFNSCFC